MTSVFILLFILFAFWAAFGIRWLFRLVVKWEKNEGRESGKVDYE